MRGRARQMCPRAPCRSVAAVRCDRRVGETRVDLQHLLEDLRDAYTGAIEETILTEVIANALDSGATRIQLRTDWPGYIAARGRVWIDAETHAVLRLERGLPGPVDVRVGTASATLPFRPLDGHRA
jgi:hypothetical protein